MVASPYLFELLYIDVELRAELGFGLGEGRDLAGQLVRFGGFELVLFALLFQAGHVVLNFQLFGPQQGMEL